MGVDKCRCESSSGPSYHVEADFVLPALSGAAGGERAAPPEIIRLDSVHFDQHLSAGLRSGEDSEPPRARKAGKHAR